MTASFFTHGPVSGQSYRVKEGEEGFVQRLEEKGGSKNNSKLKFCIKV